LCRTPSGRVPSSPTPAPHGRLPIPDHLERVVIELAVDEAERLCPHTGQPLVLIGYEESEKVEYRPGRLFVNVYRRPKYVSPERVGGNGVGVITAPLPDHPIPRCKADVGLIAYAVVSKFAGRGWWRSVVGATRDGISTRR
jgi:transposase